MKYFRIVILVILAVSVFQLFIIFSYPDIDTDSYIHFVISRNLLSEPSNLSLHWVWLPLFHYVQMFFVFTGMGFEFVRVLNVMLYISSAVLVFLYLKSRQHKNSLKIAAVASLTCILFPLGFLMGTTAQSEILFMLLVFLFAVLYEKKKFVAASVILSFTVMLRYESWAVVFFFLLLKIFESLKNKKFKPDLSYLSVILPVIVIFIWSLLRIPFDGKFLAYIFDTKEFVTGAIGENYSYQNDPFIVIDELLHYTLWIPLIYTGFTLFLIIFGLKKAVKNHPAVFLCGISILFFITLSWIFKSSLGLNRHFTALIPFCSVCAGYGFFNVTDYIEKKTGKNYQKRILILFLINAVVLFAAWSYVYLGEFKSGFPERMQTAEFIKQLSPDKKIFNNDAVLEVLGNFDKNRFEKYWLVDDEKTAVYLTLKANEYGEVYIVLQENSFDRITSMGDVIFYSDYNKRTKTRLLIVVIKAKNYAHFVN